MAKFNFTDFFSKQKNITATADGDFELNIQPQASVLGVFSRLNYKAWYARAEFVDNSTESFYTNETELKANGISTVTVNVNYDFEKNIFNIQTYKSYTFACGGVISINAFTSTNYSYPRHNNLSGG